MKKALKKASKAPQRQFSAFKTSSDLTALEKHAQDNIQNKKYEDKNIDNNIFFIFPG